MTDWQMMKMKENQWYGSLFFESILHESKSKHQCVWTDLMLISLPYKNPCPCSKPLIIPFSWVGGGDTAVVIRFDDTRAPPPWFG